MDSHGRHVHLPIAQGPPGSVVVTEMWRACMYEAGFSDHADSVIVVWATLDPPQIGIVWRDIPLATEDTVNAQRRACELIMEKLTGVRGCKVVPHDRA
jgi:hypothetical protein